ncbi:MAG: hypothetical protein JNJ71_16445 [Rubrivivax sp.]|nr:hypothetical protein [Rubrivivax sp.]
MARMTCGLALLMPGLSPAQDRAEIDRTRIVGNRELPKVIYIVPWKRPLPDELIGKPLASVLDEVLAPVDREVHRRQVAYHARVLPPGLSPLSSPLADAATGPAAPSAAAPARGPSAASPAPSPSVNPTPPQEKRP